MFYFPFGRCDLVLGTQWLHTLGPILWDFSKPYMNISIHGKKQTLKGLQPRTLNIISSHCMEDILNKNSHGVITQLHFIQMQPSVISTTPLDLSFRCNLQMPNFSKPFTIESDACDNGLSVILLQDEHPIAFTKKSISGKKEMMVILHAVQKWQPYLLGNHFCINTEHESLKYFLEQRVSSLTQ